MTPAQAARKGGKRYCYYVCTAAQRRGWRTCPSKALPAAAVEGFVLEQLRALAADPAAWNKALGATLARQCLLLADKEGEARTLDQELARLRAAYRQASPAQRVALQAPSQSPRSRAMTRVAEILDKYLYGSVRSMTGLLVDDVRRVDLDHHPTLGDRLDVAIRLIANHLKILVGSKGRFVWLGPLANAGAGNPAPAQNYQSAPVEAPIAPPAGAIPPPPYPGK
jgi:hypothetical protein